MNKLVVLIKFNKNDLYIKKKNYVPGSRFRKTLGNKEWWDNRYRILKHIVLPSLKQQTFQDFDIIASFSTDIPYGYSEKVKILLREYGASITLDNRGLKDFVEPSDYLRQKYYNKVDNIILLNCDSDDVYHKEAFKQLMKVPVSKGQVYIFRHGYVYDMKAGKLFTYAGVPVPPPFYAVTYSNDALSSQEAWDAYRNVYRLQVEHPQLNRCVVKHEMPGGLFSYIFHSHNVTSSMENPHHKDKIGAMISYSSGKEKILENLGIMNI